MSYRHEADPRKSTSGDFKYGGWTVPYFDDFLGKVMSEQMKQSFNLLLGRRTFEIFASYWPQHDADWPGINEAAKYVGSNTLTTSEWEKSIFDRANCGGNQKAKKARRN